MLRPSPTPVRWSGYPIQPAAWQIVEIKEFGFPAVRIADLEAAGLWHGFVPNDARHLRIIARDPPPREFRPLGDLTFLPTSR